MKNRTMVFILAAVMVFFSLSGAVFAEHKHEYQAEIHLATCTEEGYTRYVCACGDSYIGEKTYPARGHLWDDGVVTQEATCAEAGVLTYTCQRQNCGETRTEVIAATGEHTYQDGVCTVCGQEDPNPPAEPCPSAVFTDVSGHDDTEAPDYAFHAAIDWAITNKITYGTSNSTFSPSAGCTRAQAVTFLWRAAGCHSPKSTEHAFRDIEAGAYYYEAVLWAAEKGITVGTSENTFSPDITCTRAQIVTFLYRAMQGTPADGFTFTDVPSGLWFSDAVSWAASKGITFGIGDGRFAPDATCTRAQIVTFLWRAAQQV